MRRVVHGRFVATLAPLLLALAACAAEEGAATVVAVSSAAEGAATSAADNAKVTSTAGRLVLAVEGAKTGADGRRCVLDVKVRNDTGAAALNVQAAWMAQTEGFGIISDYQVLGEFAVGEARPVQLGIFGAPCDAVRDVKLTRTVCVVGPAADPPQSCADRVMLDGGGIVTVSRD